MPPAGDGSGEKTGELVPFPPLNEKKALPKIPEKKIKRLNFLRKIEKPIDK